MKSLLCRLLPLLLLLTLAGCGFHLRGQAGGLERLPQPLYVAGIDPYSPLGRELRQQLRLAGATLTDDAGQAAAILRIGRVHEARRLLSVDARNREAESELEESLRFSLQLPGQGRRAPAQTVRVVRTLFRPQGQVLSREREAETVRADMHRQLAGQLIQRLAAQLK